MRPPKILMTKIGLDGHDRGHRLVATYLRDAGMEVVFTGPWKSVPEVVAMATEEDVDVIGISSLASDHLLVPGLMKSLRESGLKHVEVVVGGTVPDRDEVELKAAGVATVFHPGASREDIVASIASLAAKAISARTEGGAL
jgi:methylmalonyl-CoA mutase C-terminal domain/subunit